MAQPFESQVSYLLLPILLLLPVFLYYFMFRNLKSYNLPLPPGPKPWPIFGNIHETRAMNHVTLTKLAQIYGPLMLLRQGTQFTVIGSSPMAAQEILRTNDRIMSARWAPQPVPLTRLEIQNLSFWADASSENFKRIRALCRGDLFSAKALEFQASTREEKVMEMVEVLRAKEGFGVNIESVIFVCIVNTFSNAFFSRDLIGLGEEDASNEFRSLLRGIIEAISTNNLADFFPVLSVFDLQGLRKKHREMSMGMHAVFEPIIAERIDRKRGVLRHQKDFLDTLLENGFTRTQIDKLFEELFTAGIDTTMSTIKRTIAELIRNPGKMKKLQDELDNGFTLMKESELVKLPYLQACVKETLRLYPPAPLLLSHRVLEPCQVMNYTIPKNARIIVNAWAIGRNPNKWEEPEKYIPERFLDSALDFKGNDFEFLPFGAGRRICPGLNMAAKILPLAIAKLIYFFNWSFPRGYNPNEMNLNDRGQELMFIPRARKLNQ